MKKKYLLSKNKIIVGIFVYTYKLKIKIVSLKCRLYYLTSKIYSGIVIDRVTDEFNYDDNGTIA